MANVNGQPSFVIESAIENFYDYLSAHPSLSVLKKSRKHLIFGFSRAYAPQANILKKYALERDLPYTITLLCFEEVEIPQAIEYIDNCDCFLFWYDAVTLDKPDPKGSNFIRALFPKMKEHWKKSIIFKDYLDKFYEAFSIPPQRIQKINESLIVRAKSCSKIVAKDQSGTNISFGIHESQKWTNINGKGNQDLIPGEIATHSENINGQVSFLGTFLSTIPFAKKYGVINTPLKFKITNSTISQVSSENKELEKDFNHYLMQNPSNSRVEEFGIGTNEGIASLYGQNAGLEERHCGLHLGLGGGQMGSHHLDLIFSHSEIWFDSFCVYDGTSFCIT